MATDKDTTISVLKVKIAKFVEERNWSKYHTIKSLIQAIQIEAAELSELFLFKELTKDDVLSNKELFESVSDEIADVFIYLLSLLNTLDLDLTDIFFKKMEKNSQKYPTEEFNKGNYHKK
jgi:NTP pyrophosphatase (non-canonical NTP hydrolase)